MLSFVIPKKTCLIYPLCTFSNLGPDLYVPQIIKSSHQVVQSCCSLYSSKLYYQSLSAFSSHSAGLFFIQQPLSLSMSIRSLLAVIKSYGHAVIVWQSSGLFLTRCFKYLCPSSCLGADALEMFVCRFLLGVPSSINFSVRLFNSVNSRHASLDTSCVLTWPSQDSSNIYVCFSFYWILHL